MPYKNPTTGRRTAVNIGGKKKTFHYFPRENIIEHYKERLPEIAGLIGQEYGSMEDAADAFISHGYPQFNSTDLTILMHPEWLDRSFEERKMLRKKVLDGLSSWSRMEFNTPAELEKAAWLSSLNKFRFSRGVRNGETLANAIGYEVKDYSLAHSEKVYDLKLSRDDIAVDVRVPLELGFEEGRAIGNILAFGSYDRDTLNLSVRKLENEYFVDNTLPRIEGMFNTYFSRVENWGTIELKGHRLNLEGIVYCKNSMAVVSFLKDALGIELGKRRRIDSRVMLEDELMDGIAAGYIEHKSQTYKSSAGTWTSIVFDTGDLAKECGSC